MPKLDDAIISSAGRPTAEGRLQAALAGRRVFRPIVIPGLELAAVMTVVGSERSLDIEGEVLAAMASRGIAQNVLNQEKHELERAIRTLAEAVLDSEANPQPIGTLKAWGRLAPEVIGDLWIQYSELRAQHDPAIAELTEAEVSAINDAISKKNGQLLRYFGARRLATYLLSTAAPPASSSTERSSPGPSSPPT